MSPVRSGREDKGAFLLGSPEVGSGRTLPQYLVS